MSNIDLSNANTEFLCHSFGCLRKRPGFSIVNDTDVQIKLFKRTDVFCGIRTGLITDFESREEFLVYSFVVEDIPSHAKFDLSLGHLNVDNCSNIELTNIYKKTEKIVGYFPAISDVEHSYIVRNDFELNWAFLEEETKYHSVFWGKEESKLFGRCA